MTKADKFIFADLIIACAGLGFWIYGMAFEMEKLQVFGLALYIIAITISFFSIRLIKKDNKRETLESIEAWHKAARPNPTQAQFSVQLGVHFEEFAEMLDVIAFVEPFADIDSIELNNKIKDLAFRLKKQGLQARITSRKEFLDSLGDQVVTGVGVGYCANMQVAEACHRVDVSNWSKYVDGKPLFDENGKVDKGPDYKEPDLEGLY